MTVSAVSGLRNKSLAVGPWFQADLHLFLALWSWTKCLISLSLLLHPLKNNDIGYIGFLEILWNFYNRIKRIIPSLKQRRYFIYVSMFITTLFGNFVFFISFYHKCYRIWSNYHIWTYPNSRMKKLCSYVFLLQTKLCRLTALLYPKTGSNYNPEICVFHCLFSVVLFSTQFLIFFLFKTFLKTGL